MAPVVGLLSVRGAAHEVAEGIKEPSLAHVCGASWRDTTRYPVHLKTTPPLSVSSFRTMRTQTHLGNRKDP